MRKKLRMILSSVALKRTIGLVLSLMLTLNPVIFAQTPGTTTVTGAGGGTVHGIAGTAVGRGAAVSLADAIGVAAAISGKVEALTPGQSARGMKSGMPLFLGDQVSTAEKSHLQILLRDETVFTLGANSSIILDRFVYDPATDTGKVGAQVAKGVFRFVTGKIARKDPSDMEVKLPVGNIGIRGTIVAGRITGLAALVVLLGPGEKNNAGERPGKISVRNEVQGKMESVEITRAGYGTEIAGPDVPPTPPVSVPAETINQLNADLQPQMDEQTAAKDEADPSQGKESPTEQAQQDTVEASEDLSNTQSTSEVSQSSDQQTAQAAQNATQTGSVADGIATLDQLRTITTGQFFYTQSSVSMSPSGSYLINFDIDFGARTVGGGNSKAKVTASNIRSGSPTTFALTSKSFASGGGNASFSYSSINPISADTCSPSNCTANVTVDLNNSGGVVAKTASHSVSATDPNGGGGTDTGSGTTGARSSGSSS